MLMNLLPVSISRARADSSGMINGNCGFVARSNFRILLLGSLMFSLLFWDAAVVFAQDKTEAQMKRRFYNPRMHIKKLPGTVAEVSGMILWDGYFVGHNDSGGLPELYLMDTLTGKIRRTLRIENAKNVDWEDIAHDKDFIYVGDFGNNIGNRKDLCIYRIQKSLIPKNGDATLTAERIHFQWELQTSFEPARHQHNFDCEAMICYHDRLVLFTKNWGDHRTSVYSLPKEPGHHKAIHHLDFPVDGLVTGADYHAGEERLLLCGYKNYIPLLWMIDGFNTVDLKGWNVLRFDLDDRFGAQTEGVCLGSGRYAYISAERTPLHPAHVYRADYRALADKLPITGEDIFRHEQSFVDGCYRIFTSCKNKGGYTLQILTKGGKVLENKKIKEGVNSFLTVWKPPDPKKTYVLRLVSGKQEITALLEP